MRGFCGLFQTHAGAVDRAALMASMNPARTLEVRSVALAGCQAAVAELPGAPMSGPYCYKSDDLLILFAGDLIGYDAVPWERVARGIAGDTAWFATLRGEFAFMVFDRARGTVSLVSDRRAQVPVYYARLGSGFAFSTDISTFTVLGKAPTLNADWLYEYLFFNIPVDTTTPLRDVQRLRPASVLRFEAATNAVTVRPYAHAFRQRGELAVGREALKRCVATFEQVVPRYFGDRGGQPPRAHRRLRFTHPAGPGAKPAGRSELHLRHRRIG